MSPDSIDDEPGSNPIQFVSLVNFDPQITLENDGKILFLHLPTEAETESLEDISFLWQELKYRLQSSEKTWLPGTAAYLVARDRLLDSRQLQTIAELLDELELDLKLVCTNRRQTAVAAATAGYSVEQLSQTPALTDANKPLKAEPLYIKNTVRSGIKITHPGTVFILGDLNPGGTVIAVGDICVWGHLRGMAHAGASGDRQARIMALHMNPTQLRIADAVARAPEGALQDLEPEVAYITPEGIRLAKAINFDKNHFFDKELNSWIEFQHQPIKIKN